MLLTGTVVADAETVIEEGAVVVEGSRIEAVGPRADVADRYGDHETQSYDLLLPGFVGGHVHSVQSLGRGIADDTELLDWLFDYVLPMEASLSAAEMGVAAKLGYLELIENGTTCCIDHLSVAHAEAAFEAAGEMGIRGVLGKVLMDRRSPDALREDTEAALAETGTHVTHCPSSNMKLASGVAPIEDYLDRGINVALGNDGAPCNNTLDPLTEMRQASLLGKVDSLEPTAVPARTVFEMATLNGAKAAGFERVGALREGWRADVIGLSTDQTRSVPIHDVFSHLVFAARGDDVRFTMVDGTVLMNDGEVTVVDAEAIRRRGREVGLGLDLDEEREAARQQKP